MVNEELIQKILDFLNEKHFSGQPMHHFKVEEIVQGAKLEKINIDEVTGMMLFLLNKKWVKGMRELGVAHPTAIYITETGIEKLSELENKKIKTPQPTPTKNPSNNRRNTVIYIAAIVGMIAGFFVIFDSIEERVNSLAENEIITDECVSGEFGLTIIECELGFEITRPNIKWLEITDFVSFYVPEEVISNTDSEVIGVMTIGKKGNASLSIRVIEIQQLTEQKFEDFANKFYEKLFATYHTYEHSKPFIVGDNAIFEMIGTTESGSPHIWEYLLQKHNDRIYIFIEDVRTDRSNVKETISELKQIVNSFTYSK